jgi:hypothetical protein
MCASSNKESLSIVLFTCGVSCSVVGNHTFFFNRRKLKEFGVEHTSFCFNWRKLKEFCVEHISSGVRVSRDGTMKISTISAKDTDLVYLTIQWTSIISLKRTDLGVWAFFLIALRSIHRARCDHMF